MKEHITTRTKWDFLEFFKYKFLRHTRSADHEIDRLICEVMRHWFRNWKAGFYATVLFACFRVCFWKAWWQTEFSPSFSFLHSHSSRWSVTSLRGSGERNFNAVSHKPKLTGTDWIELNWCACWFMGYGIKISFPRPPQWRHRSPG